MVDLHEGILREFADAQRKGQQRYELPTDNRLARQFRFKALNPGYRNRYTRRVQAECRARRPAPSAFWAAIASGAKW